VSLLGARWWAVPAAADALATAWRFAPPATGGSAAAERGLAMLASLRCGALLVANTACHASYNLLSFAVLARVPFTTHAALNAMRRVFIIVASARLAGLAIAPRSLAGIALSLAGFALFWRVRTRAKRGAS